MKNLSLVVGLVALAACSIQTEESTVGGGSFVMMDISAEGEADLQRHNDQYTRRLKEAMERYPKKPGEQRATYMSYGGFGNVKADQNASHQVMSRAVNKLVDGKLEAVDGVPGLYTGTTTRNGKPLRVFYKQKTEVSPRGLSEIAITRSLTQPDFTFAGGQASSSRLETATRNEMVNGVNSDRNGGLESFDSNGEKDQSVSQIGNGSVDESLPRGQRIYAGSELPSDAPPGSILNTASNPEKIAQSMQMPAAPAATRDTSAGSYFCNTTLLAFSNQDLGRPTALTGNVELPAQGGGQAVFGHFKADQSEYDARANDVIAATDSVLGGPVNRPTGQIANAPQAINETPQGTAAPTQAPATQAPPANTASAPSSTPAPAPAGQPAPAPTGTALH